jgi:hypothetical protein
MVITRKISSDPGTDTINDVYENRAHDDVKGMGIAKK